MNSSTLVSSTLAALLALSGMIAACSSGGTTTSGGSSGEGTSGGGHGTSGGPVVTPAPDPSGSSDPGPPSTSSGGEPAAAIYCGGDSTVCACSHDSAYGDLASPCSSATVGSPSLCCSTGGWPGSNGGCACAQLACDQYSSDTCICAAGGTVEHPVGSCSQPSGGVCCMNTGAYGTQICSCHADLTQCPPDEQTVSSCSVSAIGCTAEASKVSSCR